MTTQAKRMRDAIRAIGIPMRDFSVRTERHMYKGQFAGWGKARPVLYSQFAVDTAAAKAEDLAAAGMDVNIYIAKFGHRIVSVTVRESGNETGRVMTHLV